MDRTPSPPPRRRLHTPPAPLHGDAYEPYSPRRSTRVAAQRGLHPEQTSPRARRDVTPTAASKRPAARTLSFALSPSSSPIAPPQYRSPRSTRRAQLEMNPLDSDSDRVAPTPTRRFLSAMVPDMLPTPAKTPRKQRIEDVGKTARVLFRPATIEEVIPTPRKSRNIKGLYSLDSFDAHGDETTTKIPIFTDMKERVPTDDDEEENPFVSKKGRKRVKTTLQKSSNVVDARTAKMNKAVERKEGIVYIFRGKRILRKFHDGPSSNGPGASDAEEVVQDEELSADDMQLRRRIGPAAHRPLTRSSVKPKLLFQAEIAQRKLENGETDDEEAVTDIEVPIATPSRRKGKAVLPSFDATTPPPTIRKVKREVSFESWSRVKSSSSSATRETKKRSGEPLERDADKRARTRS